MDTLAQDVQNIIYRYKHQLDFRPVIHELAIITDIWCSIYLERRYSISKDTVFYNRCKATYSHLNDYEKSLMRHYRFYDIDFLHYKPPLLSLYRHYLYCFYI